MMLECGMLRMAGSLQVTGGSTTGCTSGFSFQWMKQSDFEANNNTFWASDDPRLCKAGYSGECTERSGYNNFPRQ